MKIKVRLVETNALGRAEYSEASDAAWEAVGAYWKANILPKKFTSAGGQEYRYRSRSVKYLAEKQREKGHQHPLVFTGRLQRQVTSGAQVVVKRNKRGQPRVTVKLPGPNYLKGRSTVARELKRVSAKDATELAAVLERALVEHLNRETPPKERRV